VNQRFDGPVEQVAAGDIHNYPPVPSRPLTKGERVALNALVRQIEAQCGEPGWQTWRFLHRVMGVDGVDAMRIEHRDAATELLNLRLKCSSLERAISTRDRELVRLRLAAFSFAALLASSVLLARV
jgi:hypothetical protein